MATLIPEPDVVRLGPFGTDRRGRSARPRATSPRLTRSCVLLLAALGLVFAGACGSTSDDGPRPVAFRNGLVITATGADPLAGGSVIIEDGLITAIGPDAGVTIPDNAIVVDLAGRAILPGLVEARGSALIGSLQLEDSRIEESRAGIFLERPLRNGVTTVRATGAMSEDMQTLPELRQALAEYGNSIPTVVIAGASIAHGEGPAHQLFYADQTVGVVSVEEARERTLEFIELGADQVNFLMSSGPSLSQPPEDRTPLLSLEMLTAMAETAHANGTPFVGQALFEDEALTAIEAGVDELTGWPSLTEPMSDELLAAIISHSVPVVSGFSVGNPQDGDVRRFLDAGGRLVFGTFAPNSGATPEREFLLMERHGMSPAEMIRAATIDAANAVGRGDEVGTLEVGKRADLIVVNGNPFEGNFVSVMRQVVYVVKNGELVVQPDDE